MLRGSQPEDGVVVFSKVWTPHALRRVKNLDQQNKEIHELVSGARVSGFMATEMDYLEGEFVRVQGQGVHGQSTWRTNSKRGAPETD
jgi:hypothetical protein